MSCCGAGTCGRNRSAAYHDPRTTGKRSRNVQQRRQSEGRQRTAHEYRRSEVPHHELRVLL